MKTSTEQLYTKRNYFQFVGTFVFICLFASTAILMLYSAQMDRLANSYTQAARHSLLISDLRQAVTSLVPATSNGFESVEIFLPQGQAPLRIKHDQPTARLPMLVRRSHQMINSGLDESSATKIVFTYSLGPVIPTLLFTGASLLIGFAFLLHRLRARAIEREATQKQIQQIEIEKAVSKQVAHDIRSPLATLEVIAENFDGNSAEQLSMFRSATTRIRSIAKDLLQNGQLAVDRKPNNLSEIVNALVAEKRIQFRNRSEIFFAELISPEARVAFVEINETEFCRVLSNLINNSVEAMHKGSIRVEVEADTDTAWIKVRDEGHGIPPQLLSRLGVPGASFSKEGGTGLGLFHAQKCVKSWGGTLEITSELGKGTSISFSIPRFHPPKIAVLIDDDVAMHKIWDMVARKNRIELFCFQNQAEALERLVEIPKNAVIYIDSNLGKDSEPGEIVAKRLYELGYRSIYLCTGYQSKHFEEMAWIKAIIGKVPPWSH